MKIRYLLLLIIIVSFRVNAQDINRVSKPINLEEAIQVLDILFPDSTKHRIALMAEDEFIGESHLSTGMWIRNNWGLWKGSDLSKYFNQLNIFHPDDMSGIILTSYHRHLKNQDYKLDEQVKFYQDYWKKQQEHEYKMKNDKEYATKYYKESDSIYREVIKQKTDLIKPGSRIRGWVDYSPGFVSGGRTQIEGVVLSWQFNEAKVRIERFLDEKKKNRVLRYNKVKNNEILVNYHLLEKID